VPNVQLAKVLGGYCPSVISEAASESGGKPGTSSRGIVTKSALHIAEEGITAAAYVVVTIVGDTWTIEECGDRDPSGARVGAILQALITREPVERRPTIRAWLPRGFVPPQVTIVSAKPSTEC
jgi:hypothetical protein